LRDFLAGPFETAYCAARKVALGSEQDIELADAYQRLIPSDFGFHNAMRESAGRLRFLDFDYFGWDDPVKFTADWILHPAMRFDATEKRRVVGVISDMLPEDDGFEGRLERQLPLHRVRWAAILLNLFRSDRMQAFSGDSRQLESGLQAQLAKARKMLQVE